MPSSSTVLELKKLLAAEISGDLKIEVFSDNIDASIGFQSTKFLGFEADLLGPPPA